MKETCTKATSSCQFCLWEPRNQGSSHSTGRWERHQNLIWLHKCSLVLKCWMRKEQRCFVKGWILIYMTFYTFSKTCSQFPWLFQAWNKNGITWLFQVFPWLDTPCTQFEPSTATMDKLFFQLAGLSAPTRLAIAHWIGCINALKILLN